MSDVARFIRRYATPHWRAYLAGIVALGLTNGLSVLVPWLLAEALRRVDSRSGFEAGPLPWVLGLLLASIAIIFVRTASRVLIFNPGRVSEHALRLDFFGHVLAMPPRFFRRRPLGDLVSRASHDVQFVRVLVGFAGLQLVNIAFALPLNLARMLSISLELTLGCIVPLAAATLLAWLSIRRMLTHMRRSQEEMAALTDEILETYNGVRTVHAFGADGAMLARFDAKNRGYRDLLVRIAFLRSFLLPVVSVVGNLAILVLLYRGATLVAEKRLHFGDISAYAVYVGNIVGALTSFGWVVNVIQRGQVSLRRLFEILDESADEPEPKTTLPSGPLGLRVAHLSFRYPGEERPLALDDVSFALPAGHTLGVFGPNGSGKTTLLRLLLRLELPPANTVYVGDRDALEVPLADLRSVFAVAPQTAHLFSRSLGENVALGDPDRASEPQRLQDALTRACFYDEAMALERGLDTLVGERGVTLSGGQRQRTALARAFYRDARILVLDDVLSAVDHDTEQRLVSAISAARGRQTAIIVSHRISALRHADHVIVLDRGRIVEQGPPSELLHGSGPFAEAWNREEREAAPTEASP